MFYFLPIDLKLKIWSYDDTCKINYNKCIEEINKKYKKSIYFQQSPYKTIMYFERVFFIKCSKASFAFG